MNELPEESSIKLRAAGGDPTSLPIDLDASSTWSLCEDDNIEMNGQRQNRLPFPANLDVGFSFSSHPV